MAKDKRLFARFDLDYADHPKIDQLSDGAFRAHVSMILYARKYMTDGIIPKRFANRFATESLSELLANDDGTPSLIALEDGTYLLHGYEDMNETREEIERRSIVNTENGRRGGLAKSRTAKRVAKRTATESLSEMGSENVAETETETETVKTPAPAVLVTESDFSEVWSHWPKKVERKAALDQFRRAVKNVPFDDLKAFVIEFGDAYAATTEKRFVPALDVWLRGERWTDELPTMPGAKPVSTIRPADEWRYR